MNIVSYLLRRSGACYLLSASAFLLLMIVYVVSAFAQTNGGGDFDTGQGRGGSGPANVVMIFYSVWGNHTLSTGNPADGDVFVQTENQFSGTSGWNYWGRPLYATTHGDGSVRNNYRPFLTDKNTPHNDLLDYHAELLTAAAVDVIVLDLTNGVQQDIVDGAFALCKRYEERNAAGLPTPKVVPWIQDEGSLASIKQQLFDQFPASVFFQYLGKNLILLGNNNNLSAIPTGGLCDTYTCRRMWGLNNTGSRWQFKVNTLPPPPPFTFNGQPEQMCAPVATQATFMYQNGGVVPTAQGRAGGSYFRTYMDAATQVQPRFLFIMGWNEWAAQNQATADNPAFVDLWKEEYSADVEPVFGFHGWQYYVLMRDEISRFKGGRYNSFGASRSLVREAEAFGTQSGATKTSCDDIGQGSCLTGISGGDVLVYNNVNLVGNGQRTFSYRIASTTGGRFELTGPGGSPVYDSRTFPVTDGEQTWITLYGTSDNVPTGNQTLEIRGVEGEFNLNNFAVSPSTLPTGPIQTISERAPEGRSADAVPYPNPFIQGVYLPVPTHVEHVEKVRIFTLSGSLVRVLSGSDVTQKKLIYWDGDHEQGGGLPSGTYYYEMHTGQTIHRGKLIKGQ